VEIWSLRSLSLESVLEGAFPVDWAIYTDQIGVGKMYSSSVRIGYLCLLLFAFSPYQSQAEQQQFIEVVEVTAPAIKNLAGGNIEAETYYDAEQIEALGASTLEELMEELEPDVASVRGRSIGKPIVLVNGRRIASFLEIRSYPPEAVESIEVFPEEVALKHGYRADQKVVNIRLLSQFSATTTKGGAQTSAGNGGETLKVSGGHLSLRIDQRLSFDLRAETQNEIMESDRSVPLRSQDTPFSLAGNLSPADGDELDTALSALAGTSVTSTTLPDNVNAVPLTLDALLPFANNPVSSDPQDYRSLTPERENFSGGLSYSHPLGERLLATISGNYEQTETTSYLGLPSYTLVIEGDNPFSPFKEAVVLSRFSQLSGPLKREQTKDSYAVNASLAATHSRWTWSWITSLNLTERDTSTDRRLILGPVPAVTNPFGDLDDSLQLQTNIQNTESRDYDTSFLASGTLGELPHGPISTALSLGFIRNEQRNTTSDNIDLNEDSRLTRNLAQLRGSIDLPLLNSEGTGEVSANLNAEASHYSDFDQINVFGAGLNWKLNDALRFLLSYTVEDGAPNISELGDPLLLTPNQNVYDFVNDESTSATRISGGNLDLEPDKRKVWRLSASLQPLAAHDLNFKIDWVSRDTDRPIDSFPSPSQEIEESFPERFLRNDSGDLLAFDTRPINLYSERTNEMYWGLRYTRPVTQGSRSLSAGKHSKGSRANRRGTTNGRLLFALNHSWALKDELRIAQGLESIDYVGRNTNGRGRGGSEHEIAARISYYHKGKGFRVNAKWQDSISSLPDTDGSVALNQSDMYTVNLTAFYSFLPNSPLVARFSSLRGLRMRLKIENIFDEKPKVKDQNGKVPAGSSGDELDPFGRTLKIELRKMFR
jgi:iron complex outermembrane receptor protein